eukprot:gnl/TRDRNA2_/TRDRNA2_179700_c0_seq1.p1 gnl/TRDRNA2_/TRDRNA2_179700_c0~~gnl/TRDRNA2_/TRDRNA2_179700_c0_seq1.p1  ORF type:complete len:442 (-),score=63.19 gnl/TRDRNA2_/TRDRNA2_179700_c0_seq1:80-1405(-)
MTDEMELNTICIHGGFPHEGDSATTARAVPLHRTTSYQFKNVDHAADLFALRELGNIYTRLQNPTTDILEKRVCLLHGAPELGGLGVASGTNAIFYAIVNLAEAGDNIIAANNMYGGTMTMFNDILPKFGIRTKFVDPNVPGNFEKEIDGKTRCLFCETCSNPALDVSDLEAISAIAHKHGLPLVVDETFTTPYLQRPLDHGADILVCSLTKWTGGHGTAIGGIVVDGGKFKWGAGKHPLYTEPDTSYHGLRWAIDLPEPLLPLAYILRMRTVPLRNLGGCVSPDNSWMFLQGIETLPLRMERHCQNSLAIAEFLSKHPCVEWVRYPGLKADKMYALNQKYLKGKGGGMVVFGVKGGKEAGMKFINSLQLISHVANVGDAKTLAIHPATTTHSQLSDEQMIAGGIRPELIRLSVGIEGVKDILRDADRALRLATQGTVSKM